MRVRVSPGPPFIKRAEKALFLLETLVPQNFEYEYLLFFSKYSLYLNVTIAFTSFLVIFESKYLKEENQMENPKYFYEVDKYISTEFSKKQAELLVGKDIKKLFDNKDAMKRFKEEVYPTIKLAEYLRVPHIHFCGKENKSIDAELKNCDDVITKVECTTSIDGYCQELVSEYNGEYGSCVIGPHSKAFNVNNIEQACSNDIVYSGTQHKRKFVQQQDLDNKNAFKNCLVDVNKYVEEDIEKIKNKVDKGNRENKYKSFILLLVCGHNIDIQQVPEYQNLVCKYLNDILPNPFCALFVVNYYSLLFEKSNNYNSELNPSCVPVPLLFIDS